MQCMEIWGGNTTSDRAVSIAGVDAWVFSRPYQSSEVGGDVYYVSSCATGRIARWLLADVSGHGAKVSAMAVTLRTLMRRFVNHLDQRQFVRTMNARFTEMSSAGSFATAVVMTLFSPTNLLSVCNAGHPAPLHYRAKSREWALLGAREAASDAPGPAREGPVNIPLGIEGAVEYEQFDVALEPADLVLCYSDSLIESRGADGEMLGEAGLLRLVNTVEIGEPGTMVNRLLDVVASQAPGNLADDDVTLMLFRPTGGVTEATLRDRLAAPVRIARGVVGSLFGRGPIPLPDLGLANIGGAIFSALNRTWVKRPRPGRR